jgi:hypothetical protein
MTAVNCRRASGVGERGERRLGPLAAFIEASAVDRLEPLDQLVAAGVILAFA